MAMKPKGRGGQKLYTAVDVLAQAKGLPTPEGWGVLTKEFIGDLCDELERLYQVEEAACTAVIELRVEMKPGSALASGNAARAVAGLADCCGISLPD